MPLKAAKLSKVIVVSHDASRSGAPILLLHILRWMRREKNVIISTILIRDGELRSEFEEIGSVKVIQKPKSVLLKVVERITARKVSELGHRLLVKRIISEFSPDVVYANTAVSLGFLGALHLKIKCPVICHVHELNYMIENFVGKSLFVDSLPIAKHFIAVADAVRLNLIEHYQVESKKISIVREPIEIHSNHVQGDAVREELKIPKNSFMVVGAGTVHWRKGVDLFLLSALLANKLDTNISFVWFGTGNERIMQQISFDIRKLKLCETVFFVGAKRNLDRYLAAGDLFYLTSREDPYPLVCLEAAANGKPIICFDESGGIPEFVRQGAGHVVPYMDLNAAVSKILDLKNDNFKLKVLGDFARRKVCSESAIDIVGPNIWKVFESNRGE